MADKIKQTILPTKLTVSPTVANITVNEKVQLVPTITPEDTTNKKVLWQSLDPSVATVDDNGLVTGVKKGAVFIKATCEANQNLYRHIEVHVTEGQEILPINISVESSTNQIYIGDSLPLSVYIIPSTTTNKEVTWSSADNSIATVSEIGILQGASTGTVKITATSKADNSISGYKTFYILQKEVNPDPEPDNPGDIIIPVTNISINPTTATIEAGNEVKLAATLLPTDTTQNKITWSSSNDSVATVDESGLVTGINRGTAIITAIVDETELTDESFITVTKEVAPTIKNISVSNVTTYGTYFLSYTIEDENNDNLNVYLKINDNDYMLIASNQNNGQKIYKGSGLKIGTHKLYLKVSDGKSETISNPFNITIDSNEGNNELSNLFTAYTNSLTGLRSKLQKGIDKVAQVKSDNAIDTSIKYTESKMSILDDKINLKVSKTDYNSDKQIIDERFSQIQQTADGITLEVNKKVGKDNIISSINQTAEAIKINASKINLNGYVTISDLGDYVTEGDLGKYGTTTIHGGRIETDSIKLNCLDTNSENAILKLFPTTAADGTKGYCSIDATQKDEIGRGSAIRLKWDSMNYMLQKRSGVDFYMEPREVGAAFSFQSGYGDSYTDGNETKIITKEGTLGFRGDRGLFFYTSNSNKSRKLLTSYDFNNSVSSTSTSHVATSYAVKQAYDKANHSHPYASSSHGHDVLGTGTAKAIAEYNSTHDRYVLRKHIPSSTNMELGTATHKWGTLYTTTAINTSDRKFKENIQYLDEVSTFRASSENVPFLEFIKNNFRPATYRYKVDGKPCIADNQLGFIANDILDTEVGQTFLYDFGEDGIMFSPTGYTTVVAKALQEEISKREALESRISQLELIIQDLVNNK